jgi:hypothetical protein
VVLTLGDLERRGEGCGMYGGSLDSDFEINDEIEEDEDEIKLKLNSCRPMRDDIWFLI